MTFNILTLSPSNFFDTQVPTRKWDEVGEEQINKLLDFLPSYTYFNTPYQTLRQYTDVNFVGTPTRPNYQKEKCTEIYSSDIWVSSPSFCKRYPDYKLLEFFSNYKNQTDKYCIPISLRLQDCADTDIECFTRVFYSRYNAQNAYIACNAIKQQMVDNVNLHLRFAKNEDIVKINLNLILDYYRQNFTLFVKDKYDAYKKRVKSIFSNLTALKTQMNGFEDLFEQDPGQKYTGKGKLNKFGILKNCDCSYIYDNKRAFFFMQAAVAESILGIAFILIFLSIALFGYSSILIIMYMNLRTNLEISGILEDNIFASNLLKKENDFSSKAGYIDDDDKILMGIELKKDDKTDKLSNEKLKIANGKLQNGGGQENDDNNENGINELQRVKTDSGNNEELEQKRKDADDIIKSFILRQERELDKRREEELNKEDKDKKV